MRIKDRARKRTAAIERSGATSSRDKVRAHRERMRHRGMKLIQIWVPDPTSPYFAKEARRQARLLANSPHAAEDQALVDAISEWKPD